MSLIADRLRGIVRPARSSGSDAGPRVDDSQRTPDERQHRPGPADPALRAADAAADILEGEWRRAGDHRFLIVDRSYAPGHRHGSIAVADGLPPQDGWPRLSLLGGATGGNLLFIDLETTGLAGGAGTYAFLVGCAWFERGRFRVRQFFLSDFASERALLGALGEVVEGAATVVTFNGKSFDLPLIETRYALNRLATPFVSMPHIDMLHPARRLWRRFDDSHRLSSLEQRLLGHEREGDVPGFEIPARYFRYVHSGDARPLGAVFEHNRMDLLSLALLTARAALLLHEGAEAASTAREAFGLGGLYERAGLTTDALACFTRAAETGSSERAEALRAFAVLSRRLRRYDDAAEAWHRLLAMSDCPPHIEREAAEALAVHHEHRLRSPLSARSLAQRSLQLEGSAARRQATAHRLARLDRKLARPAPGAAPLFQAVQNFPPTRLS